MVSRLIFVKKAAVANLKISSFLAKQEIYDEHHIHSIKGDIRNGRRPELYRYSN